MKMKHINFALLIILIVCAYAFYRAPGFFEVELNEDLTKVWGSTEQVSEYLKFALLIDSITIGILLTFVGQGICQIFRFIKRKINGKGN